jgi:hypothetical protein
MVKSSPKKKFRFPAGSKVSRFTYGGRYYQVGIVKGGKEFFIFREGATPQQFMIHANKRDPWRNEVYTATLNGWITCWARPRIFEAAVRHLDKPKAKPKSVDESHWWDNGYG